SEPRPRPALPATIIRAPSPPWRRCGHPSTPFSRRCWSTTPIRRCAPIASTSWRGCATPCIWWQTSRRCRARLASLAARDAHMSVGLLALLDDVAGIAKLAATALDDVVGQASRAGLKAAGAVIDDAAVTPRYVQG